MPAMHVRRAMVASTHDNLRHIGTKKVLAALQANYWWPTMRIDVAEIVGNCAVCAGEKYRFE